jgi:hypothetical protein
VSVEGAPVDRGIRVVVQNRHVNCTSHDAGGCEQWRGCCVCAIGWSQARHHDRIPPCPGVTGWAPCWPEAEGGGRCAGSAVHGRSTCGRLNPPPSAPASPRHLSATAAQISDAAGGVSIGLLHRSSGRRRPAPWPLVDLWCCTPPHTAVAVHPPPLAAPTLQQSDHKTSQAACVSHAASPAATKRGVIDQLSQKSETGLGWGLVENKQLDGF